MTKKPDKDKFGAPYGRHYNNIIYDDLASAPTNQSPTATLTQQMIEDSILKLWNSNLRIKGQYAVLIAPGLKSIFEDFLRLRRKWSKEEMAKQVELYKNVIETKYGVKLCVKDNKNKDITTMELLVPNKLFHNEDGRTALADALQNIAMFVMSMDNPELD